MQKLLCMVVLVGSMSVLRVNAQNADRHVLAEELLSLMNMQGAVEATYKPLKEQVPMRLMAWEHRVGSTNVSSQVRSEAERLKKTIDEELNWSKLKADHVTLYADRYSEEELKSIIAFFKTPAGKAFVEKQPALIIESKGLSFALLEQHRHKYISMIDALKKLAEDELVKQLGSNSPARF
jgi:hypothetical protein